MRLQILVGPGERPAAQKSPMRREWAGVRRLDHKVAAPVNICPFLLGMAAPQDKNQRLLPLIQLLHHRIGESLPTEPFMGVRLAFPDRQHSIQQQNPFLRPVQQRAVVRNGNTHVFMQLCVDIAQGWRYPHSRFDREAEPMCLSCSMIGVLPQNNYPCSVVGCQLKRREQFLFGRIDCVLLVFPCQRIAQLLKIGFLRFFLQNLIPIVAEHFPFSFRSHACYSFITCYYPKYSRLRADYFRP
ncbi:hypothetical protein D3C74_293650 [compost metagenome]